VGLLERFPDAVWMPGFGIEFGMTAEPSAFGAKLRFHANSPPSIEPTFTDLAAWADVKPADPQEDGLMPLLLRLYEVTEARVQAEGLGIRMVCTRGPMTVASWLVGRTPLMLGLVTHPDLIYYILQVFTETIVRWLHAQLDILHEPEGIMLLDDVVGMVSRRHYETLVQPHLRQVFDEFEDLIRVYHNDTPCSHLVESLATAGFDVFSFSHELDIAEVKARMDN
jgi:uroporphyrinogen decarboxylase